eukprot:767069_1
MASNFDIIKLFNHKILRIILIVLCCIYVFIYVLEIHEEKTFVSLNDAIPMFFEDIDSSTNVDHSLGYRSDVYKARPLTQLTQKPKDKPTAKFRKYSDLWSEYNYGDALSDYNHYDPITYEPPANVPEFYSKTNPLKIKIAIPTSAKHRDNNLRKMQRLSWIKYLDQSNQIWNEMHSRCSISYHYFAGVSDDEEANRKMDEENEIYGDIVRLNVTESWQNLQRKTIEVLISEYLMMKH